jgi:hypothetical protein
VCRRPIQVGVLADRRQTRELPFVPTLLCLWGAGWVTSALTTLLFAGQLYPTHGSPVLMVAVNLMLSAVVGAVVVRHLLVSVVGRELSYSAILLALVAGSTAATVARLALFAQLSHSASPAFPVALSFVPSMLGAVVSWWLLQNAARAETPVPAEPSQLVAATRVAYANPYAERVAAARESALGLVAAVDAAEPASVTSLVADGMLSLEAARKRLEETPPPDHVPPELPRRLAEGMRQLADELAATSDEAALTGTGGARYRWELDRSPGLQAVRQALAEFHALGY